VVKAFKNVDLIVHAGDIGKLEIFETLHKIAPVVAVRGNMDGKEWAHSLPWTEVVKIGKVMFYVLHDIYTLDLDPAAAGFAAVISGHSHRPSTDQRDGVLFINPGSATEPRYHSPASVVLLQGRGTVLEAQFIDLEA
jgi:putative phosphoesterase